MSPLRILLAASGGASEARLLRRLTKVWLATGAVPVAHIVADCGDTANAALPELRPAAERARRSHADWRVLPC